MPIFLGYFIWGLILAAPLSWLIWRFNLLRWLPRWSAARPRRAVRLPPQAQALVIRGKRQAEGRR
nr:hypothetical protein [uncultured Cupriavidus sp.]